MFGKLFNRMRKNAITGTAYVYSVVKFLTDSQQAMADSRERQMDRHMPIDEESGHRTPKLMRVDLPNGTEVRASSYAISRTHSMGLTKAVVICNPRIVGMEMIEEDDQCEQGEMSYRGMHAEFFISPSHEGGANSLRMELHFERRDPSESESRILESLDHISSDPVVPEKPKEPEDTQQDHQEQHDDPYG